MASPTYLSGLTTDDRIILDSPCFSSVDKCLVVLLLIGSLNGMSLGYDGSLRVFTLSGPARGFQAHSIPKLLLVVIETKLGGIEIPRSTLIHAEQCLITYTASIRQRLA